MLAPKITTLSPAGVAVASHQQIGALARLLALVAELKANVLHIYHDRYVKGAPLNITYVELELETRSHAHGGEVAGAIRKAGYDMALK